MTVSVHRVSWENTVRKVTDMSVFPHLFFSDSWAPISHQKWFYLTISLTLNSLKIPDQIHHCTRAELVWLFHARTLPAILFASTLAVEKYQLAWYIIKHMIHKKVNFEHRNASRHWKLLSTECRSRGSNTGSGWLTQCPNFCGLFTSKFTWHYTWTLKSKR